MGNQQSLNELALFAGAGGGILASHLLGWRTICAVEWEAYPASVLCARQNDGILPPFPIWDDVQTFDGKPWKGIVDVVSGGFPCQDISAAGKGAGIEGERSGMWKHMARIIGEVRPRYVFVENSPMLTTRGLGVVLGDLAKMGFDAEWGVLSANNVGAPHLRERIWILATNSSIERCNDRLDYRQERQVLHDIDGNAKESQSTRERRFGRSRKIGEDVANTRCEFGESRHAIELDSKTEIGSFSAIQSQSSGTGQLYAHENVGNSESAGFTTRIEGQGERESWGASIGTSQWWEVEPPLDRVADGMADRVDRLKAIGNGQVPLCAATAFRLLNERILEDK